MRNRRRNTIYLSTTALSLAIMGGTTIPANASAASERVAGTDRFLTSVAISKKSFPDGATTVYLARGDDLSDALAGGVLTDGPILLVNRSLRGVSPEALAEINRLNPARVVALGSSGAVSDSILASASRGRQSSRLQGENRYATAVAISRHVFPNGARTAYLANGVTLADAVSAGSVTDGPILPVAPSGYTTPATVHREIARLNVSTVHALGSTAAVSDAELNKAVQASTTGSVSASRSGGVSRYATSAAIARHTFPSRADVVYLGEGTKFADAVPGGTFKNGPVLLVNNGVDLSDSLDYVKSVMPKKIVVLGGTSVVSDSMVKRFVDAANGETPVDPTIPAGWNSTEYEILKLTNVERTKAGMSPVAPQSCLHKIARNWSTAMAAAGAISHGNASARIDTCFPNSYSGENVAYGYSSPREVVAGWMASPGHRANILNAKFKYLGVGVAYKGSTPYYTQDFSSENY